MGRSCSPASSEMKKFWRGLTPCGVARWPGADEGVFGGEETPWEMRGSRDADAVVAQAADGGIGRAVEGRGWAHAEVGAVVLAPYPQCNGEFAGAGAQGFGRLGTGVAGSFLGKARGGE